MLPSLISEQAGQGPAAILALADGTVFNGVSIGANGHCVSEIVFNTVMLGQQEVITDPAYSQQIVAFTYPHIGNTGINTEDAESSSSQVSGLVVRDCPILHSNFRASQSLPAYLKEQGIVAISGVDTRKLTRILRKSGPQAACILVEGSAEKAQELIQAHQESHTNQNRISEVSTVAPVAWTQGQWQLDAGFSQPEQNGPHVVVLDLGVKHSLLRELAQRGCRVTVVPAASTIQQIQALSPQAVVVAGGPNQVQHHSQAQSVCRELQSAGLPLLGLGSGMQCLALALGATLVPASAPCHGANYPIQDVTTGKVFITTQKYEFTVEAKTLPSDIQITHTSLVDGSIQGFRHTDALSWGIQAYLEGAPGPHDFLPELDSFLSHLSV